MVYRENNPRILENKTMKTIGIKIMRFLPVLLVWVMASGCIYEDMDISGRMQKVLIQVNVSAEQMTRSVAAVSSDSEDVINSVRIYAFYNNQQSGYFYRDQASSEPIVMDLLLPVSGTHDVEFYVIANEAAFTAAQDSPELGEYTTREQLNDVCMGAIEDPSVNGLPLYFNSTVGINVDNLSANSASQIHPDHYWLVQQLDVDLVHPVSKLSVHVAQAEQGSEVYQTENPALTVTSVEISNVTSTGYLFDENDATGTGTATFIMDNDVAVTSVIGEQNGNAIENSDNYTEVMAPHYFFENSCGGSSWSSGYVEAQTDIAQISQGAMMLEIGYSFDGGATSSYAYVKMPKIEKNVFYKVMCRFSPVGGHQEILITINDWNYIKYTYGEITVKSK